MNQDKAVVVNTGSLYSTILLAKVVAEKGAENVTSVYFEGELINNAHAVEKLTQSLNVHNVTMSLDPLIYCNEMIFRNGIYAALAVEIAVTIGAGVVYMATWSKEEFSHADAGMKFSMLMSEAVLSGTNGGVSLVFPFHRNTIEELIILARRERFPIEHSYSCHHTDPWMDDVTHCGECPGCLARMAAFMEVGIIDPAQYKINLSWENCEPF